MLVFPSAIEVTTNPAICVNLGLKNCQSLIRARVKAFEKQMAAVLHPGMIAIKRRRGR